MLLRRITLQNLLSFGLDETTLELGPLNVVIGPNGSGKSNLIAAIGLLQAAPGDLTAPIAEAGGIGGWLAWGVRCVPYVGLCYNGARAHRSKSSGRFLPTWRRFTKCLP